MTRVAPPIVMPATEGWLPEVVQHTVVCWSKRLMDGSTLAVLHSPSSDAKGAPAWEWRRTLLGGARIQGMAYTITEAFNDAERAGADAEVTDDPYLLATLITERGDGEEPAGELFEALLARFGRERAEKAWDNAWNRLHHENNVDATRRELADRLAEAQAALRAAQAVANELVNETYDVEFDGVLGSDVATLIGDAARPARIAEQLVRGLIGTAQHHAR